jgi:hypothetical protein
MLIIINEVTINRSVEPETIARSGARMSSGVLLSARPPKVSHTSIAILATAAGQAAESGT